MKTTTIRNIKILTLSSIFLLLTITGVSAEGAPIPLLPHEMEGATAEPITTTETTTNPEVADNTNIEGAPIPTLPHEMEDSITDQTTTESGPSKIFNLPWYQALSIFNFLLVMLSLFMIFRVMQHV